MRFTWTEEQELLRSMLRRFVDERYSFQRRQQEATAGQSIVWNEVAELGVLAMLLPGRHGCGGTALESLIVAEAFGRGLVVEPFVSTVVLGAGLVGRLADDATATEALYGIASGERKLALAYAERPARFELAVVTTRASRHDAGYRIDGSKTLVLGAPAADVLVTVARTSGADDDPEGISVFLVPRTLAGVSLRPYVTVDGFAAAEVEFERALVPAGALLGEPGKALRALGDTIDDAILASCAEAVGIMAALNERCVAHCKARVAFGRRLADFQVLQHRLVDMEVAWEQAAAIVLKAATRVAARAPEAARAVAACKVKVSDESGFVGKAAVQLHGAMGITEELDVGHYFRRLVALRGLFGSRDHHLRRYMRLGAVREIG